MSPLLLAASLLVLSGCGDDEPAAPLPPCSQVDGVGVELAPVCDADACTAGVSCGEVLAVSSPESLSGVLAGAGAGSCIVLAPGTYGAVELPGGASLLGKGPAFVHVGRVTVRPGTGSVVRGVDVRDGVVLEDGAVGASLEAACVSSPSGSAVDVGAGASVFVSRSHLADAADYGVRAFDAAEVRLERTLITNAGAPGIWAQCSDGCGCAARPDVALEHVIVRDASLVGVALHGVNATLNGLSISGTQLRDFKGGGGLSLAACTEVNADDVAVEVRGTSDLEAYGAFGILADSVSGRIGTDAEKAGIIIVGGRPGVWVMDSAGMGGGLRLEGFEITGSNGVGLGVSSDTVGIIIVGGKVANTSGDTVALAEGGAGYVGDGLSWQSGAQLTVDGLELQGSARQSILIDGAVGEGSSLADVALSGGDEQTGILQQGVSQGDQAPAMGQGAPQLTQNPERPLEVPAAPKPPLAI